jgi:acyl homoserine lactone synthase
MRTSFGEVKVRFFVGKRSDMPDGLREAMGGYRHQVFVEKLKWPLQCAHGLEFDQFDREDTLYVIAQEGDDEQIVGVARLLPTTSPYLLQEVFPHLPESPLPVNKAVWELSRFAAVNLKSKLSQPSMQFSNHVVPSLLEKVFDAARQQGAEELISVSPLGVEKLLKRLGVCSKRLNGDHEADLLALKIDIPNQKPVPSTVSYLN